MDRADWRGAIRAAFYATQSQAGRAVIDAIRGRADVDEIVESLRRDRDPEIRSWLASVAPDILGARAAAGLLRSMSRSDRDETTRVVARTELEHLDPEAIQDLVPDLLTALGAAKDPFGEARNAMWILARLRIVDAVVHLRAFAARWPSGDYGHMMPLVLANYIEDPDAINRRLESHDHDWTFWLAEAAALIPTNNGINVVRRAAATAPDAQCQGALNEVLRTYRDPI